MHKIMAWWFKHSLLIMAFTIGLYGLGQLGAMFELVQFPFKILLMLLMIEITPLGAVAGWVLRRLINFFITWTIPF